MLTLIKSLTAQKGVVNSYLARAQLNMTNIPYSGAAAIPFIKGRLTVMRADGFNSSGAQCAELSLYLMSAGKITKEPVRAKGSTCLLPEAKRIYFTEQDIKDYLRLSFDTNPIHSGSDPIIPGLMLIMRLWDGRVPINISARFLCPMRLHDEIYILRDNSDISFYAGTVEAAKINIMGEQKNDGKNKA